MINLLLIITKDLFDPKKGLFLCFFGRDPLLPLFLPSFTPLLLCYWRFLFNINFLLLSCVVSVLQLLFVIFIL